MYGFGKLRQFVLIIDRRKVFLLFEPALEIKNDDFSISIVSVIIIRELLLFFTLAGSQTFKELAGNVFKICSRMLLSAKNIIFYSFFQNRYPSTFVRFLRHRICIASKF